jgi:hypothetical protein
MPAAVLQAPAMPCMLWPTIWTLGWANSRARGLPLKSAAVPDHIAEGKPMSNPYAAGLDKNPANYVPLTPLTFIERSAYIYPERVASSTAPAAIPGLEEYERSRRLASALAARESALAIRWR